MLIRDLLPTYLAASPEIQGTQLGALLRMQKESIGACDAKTLTPKNVIDFAVTRGRTVCASTISQDIIYLRNALDYAKTGLGIDGVSTLAFIEAMPVLRRKRLVGSSSKRTRIPSAEETQAILAHVGPGLNADVIAFQDYSARRISETCRLQWGDLDESKKTILVRDLKHPRIKFGYNKRAAIPNEAFDIIMRQKRMTSAPDERIYKVIDKTIEAVYARAVRACKIQDLHLHDSRRGTITRLLKQGESVQRVMLVSLHANPTMILTVYNGLKAEDYHA